MSALRFKSPPPLSEPRRSIRDLLEYRDDDSEATQLSGWLVELGPSLQTQQASPLPPDYSRPLSLLASVSVPRLRSGGCCTAEC